MVASKRKKKPASNPARGFATTSTVSRAKKEASEETIVDHEPQDFQGDQCNGTKTTPEKVNSQANGPKTSERALHELSPDELEIELENSALQELVDTHSESVRKLVERQVSRLKTERRLLRSQAAKLNSHQWLSRTVIDSVSSRLASGTPPSESEQLIRLWVLHEVLPQLGFSSLQSEAALRSISTRCQQDANLDQGGGKDLIWGLDYCLAWLALNASQDDAPRYDEKYETASRNQQTAIGAVDHGLAGDFAQDPIIDRSTSKTPQRTEPVISSSDTITTDELGSESSSDSDMDQTQMLNKYVSLQTRRFHLDPQTPEKQVKKFKQVDRSQAQNPMTRRIARIDTKLTRLRSDILFDLDQADQQWSSTRIALVKEAAERRRLDVAPENPANQAKSVLTSAQHDPPAPTQPADADEDALLGALFSSLPESFTSTDHESSGMQMTDTNGKSIMIRDFGKWNGLSPRRILEETCRARDPSHNMRLGLLAQSSFSKRHFIHIQWSSIQSVLRTPALDGISYQNDGKSFYIRMESISCPEVAQSEAFIATVALFLVFGSSPEREKARVRLPGTWRDVWQEMLDVSNQQIAEYDRDVLKKLRCLRQDVQSSDLEMSQSRAQSAPNARSSATMGVNGSLKSIETTVDESIALKEMWSSRAADVSYQSMLKSREKLPIWKYKSELLQSVKDHQVVIICGETGCGKSTQVPAYILEEELSNAISLARRVSEEIGERRGEVGTSRSIVGYAIRLESKMTSQTRLVYATTGIVMRMLESHGGLDEVTHLILDEVHERSIESDFLLIVLRKIMIKRPNLKVVLMSATVDAQRFSAYLDNAPIMTVPGRTFPVDTRFLEDAIEAIKFRSSGVCTYEEDDDNDLDEIALAKLKSSDTGNLGVYSARTRETLANFDEYKINYDLIVGLLGNIATSSEFDEYSKAILVFLPGIAEIRRLNDMLTASRVFACGWNIYPLHSSIATEEQEHAFLVPPPGVRKMVIATNIAETGITIPDVTCVIDTGKHKEMRFDERRQLSKLIESFISRANAKQRRGRAGRVQKGLCFHLFTKHRHDSLMAGEQTPEMLRLSLQDLVLRVKICKLGGIEQTLSEALDPPSVKNVRRAIDALIDVKALTGAEDLTPLGQQLARLPLDALLGKLILLGVIFNCLNATLSIAAILSSKSPFSAPMQARSQADTARIAFKSGDSDLLTVYNAYRAWQRICSDHSTSEQQFCRKNFLSSQTLMAIEELKGQLLVSLADARFVTLDPQDRAALAKVRSWSRHKVFVPSPPQYNLNDQNYVVLNSVIAWSFYPKLLRRDGKGWRNVANNQSVSLHPSSVNKGLDRRSEWLSFYHIMQSSNKFFNAHETSTVDDFAVALLCGEADFRMYSGVIIIDGNRIRFSVDDWKKMLAIRSLRTQLRNIMSQKFRHPEQPLSLQQQGWFDIWQKMCTREEKKITTAIV